MFTKDVYSGRRATLKKMISKGIAFFPANNEAPFNYPDNTYIYRQDSNFSYFFGLKHPDMVGVIDFESGEEILFGVDVTIDAVIWCGPLPSLKEQGDSIDKFKPFEPGMILTCEPGIYIREEGIGIRIENDLLITESEPINLFEGLPTEIEEIEDAMRK